VVLEWSIGDDGCETAVRSPGYACVSDNSSCYNAASGRGYICNCTQGFEGNPYLPNGCKGTVNPLPILSTLCHTVEYSLRIGFRNCFGQGLGQTLII
jgi:hypothetical protein